MQFSIFLWLLSVTLRATIVNTNRNIQHKTVDQIIVKQEAKMENNAKNSEEGGAFRKRRYSLTADYPKKVRKGSATTRGSSLLPDHWRKLSEDVYLQPVSTSRLDQLQAQLGEHLQVRVAAVAENIEVLVDHRPVYSIPADKSSGFHVLALSPWDGRMLLKRHFDTGQLGDGVLMRSCLASLQPGTLVVLIPMFNAGDNLGTTEKFLLEKLGMEGYGVGGAVKGSPAPYLEETSETANSDLTSNLIKVGQAVKSGPDSNVEKVLVTVDPGSNNFQEGVRRPASASPPDKYLKGDSQVEDNPIKVKESSGHKQKIKHNDRGASRDAGHRARFMKNWMNSSNNSKLSLNLNQTSNGDGNKPAMEGNKSRHRKQWKEYIHSVDPSVLIGKVPQGWPPEHKKAILRGKVYAETAIIFMAERLNTSDLEMTAMIQRHQGQHCPWHDDPARAAQLRFCSLYEGYGALCRCQDPIIPERLRRAAPPITMTETIPVAMLTATKSYFFYRQLVNLLTTPGAAQTSILVLIDGYHKETAQLAELFGLPTVIHTHEGAPGTPTPLNAHLRFSVHRVFSIYTNSSKAIILEDDLLLSPDFLSYFQQTAWLLDADPSLYCVNSFSLNSYATVASDVGRLRRSELFPQYGWMVTRKWAEELLHLWISNRETDTDWDWWLTHAGRNKGRHAIVPEVSRSFHLGSSGTHVTGLMQATLFSTMIYNQDLEAELRDLDS